MSEWAENECRIACGRENPNYNFDGNDFDYGCDCYKSALKAFKSLMDDGHSGMSFSFTKNILERLMEGLPLTPITDSDFFSVEQGTEDFPAESEEYLKERGLRSSLQCPRMSRLFRKETLDGKVSYHDVDRCVCVNVESPSDTYSSGIDRIVDEMFPITMPYNPTPGVYKLYVQTFLVDKKNGDFDTKGILYVETPKGKRVDVNKFMTERDGEWVDITKEEYDELLERRIDKLNMKIAEKMIWTLIYNSSDEKEIKRRSKAYSEKSDEDVELYLSTLNELCKFYLKPENYMYNTFSMEQALCCGKSHKYEDVPELCEIAKFLKYILDDLK